MPPGRGYSRVGGRRMGGMKMSAKGQALRRAQAQATRASVMHKRGKQKRKGVFKRIGKIAKMGLSGGKKAYKFGKKHEGAIKAGIKGAKMAAMLV